MVLATPDAARRLAVYYATDCRMTAGPEGPAYATSIPIADGADEAALLLAKLRWAAFVRIVERRHTAAVAALASAASRH
jgi:hypothetical protein